MTTSAASLTPETLGAALPVLAAAAEALDEPFWLVGGAVRDALLGAPVHDLDLALRGGSVAAARRLADRLGAAFVPLGEPHGVARVVVEGAQRVVVDLADLRCPTLAEDLAGRDVTVDALAVSGRALLQGRAPVFDPIGGLADLAARRIRACRPSAFRDDPVRVWRALRLACALGFAIEAETKRSAQAHVAALPTVAAERVGAEVTRLLRLQNCAPALREAEAWSALSTIVPELAAMRATDQSAPHRFTVWEHSIRALEAAEMLLADLTLLAPHDARIRSHLAEPLGGEVTRHEVLKLAVLLHDVAKPETRSVDPDGRVRFTGHDRLGAERAATMATRLRWPGRATRVLACLVRQHLRPMHLAMLPEISRRARYRFFRDLGDEVADLVCLTIADAAATDGRPPAAVYRGATRALLASLLAGEAEARRETDAPPLLRGEDVMAAFGLPPGPGVGRLLARAREAQALGLVRTREEALAWLAHPEARTDAAATPADGADGN